MGFVLRANARPSVSALIVTYQHGPYVRQAVESALAEPEVSEVVLIDDGSTDDTIARAKAVDDVRLRIIRSEHRGLAGLAATYNDGYRAAHGDLIAILEGDDRWPRGKMARQLPHFLEAEVVVSHGPYAVINAHDSVVIDRVEAPHRLRPGAYDALPLSLVSSYVMGVTAVIRRSALDRIGGFHQLSGTPHWDYPTFLRLSEIGRFAYASDVVGLWRRHGRSGTALIAGRDLSGADLAKTEAFASLARMHGRAGLPTSSRIVRAWADAAARNAFHVARTLSAQGRRREARAVALRGLSEGAGVAIRARLLALTLAITVGIDPELFRRRRRSAMLDELV